jgi:hypothetical protein
MYRRILWSIWQKLIDYKQFDLAMTFRTKVIKDKYLTPEENYARIKHSRVRSNILDNNL